MVTDQELSALAAQVAKQVLEQGQRIVTAESCTGGWIAKVFTDLPGSSRWFECGFVTYSEAAKMRDLGVSARTLDEHGAVSEATVREMAVGALRVTRAAISIAVSGIAGPEGGSDEKPVGTVWFCVGSRGLRGAPIRGAGSGLPSSAGAAQTAEASGPSLVTDGQLFGGDREAVRRVSVEHALKLLARLDALR
ncbi:MAG TPA: nicotinamide-nucleotide amidohydrolase family protein [Steroidobacteraceae bacterium]|jgi:nicotinamide-nucleotide amidase